MNNRKTLERFGIIPSIIDKVVYIGKLENEKIFCNIQYKNGKLSITGVIEPKKNGDASSCGQIVDTIDENLKKISYADNWDRIKATQFVEIWKDWHLNDMNAGTQKQEIYIKNWLSKTGKKYEYNKVCEMLKTANLYNDNGYTYSEKWLSCEVPKEVLNFLVGLSDSKIIPAWV